MGTTATLLGMTGPAVQASFDHYRISAYATANTAIRFRNAEEWENAGETRTIDNVNIDYSVGDGWRGDFAMTGSYIRTCDDTLIAAAFGQYPSLSGSGDSEAMDLGNGIPPYGSQIRLQKTSSASFVSPGDEVTYTYRVKLIQTLARTLPTGCPPAGRCKGPTSTRTASRLLAPP